jgi:hypothetical protein
MLLSMLSLLSLWCFCGPAADPADVHLDERLEEARIHWEELGQLKEPRG